MKRAPKNNVRKWLWAVLALLVLAPYIGLYIVKRWYDGKVDDIANARIIIVDKEQMRLHLMDYEGNEVRSYGICCGKNYGDKQVVGDMKTPEGIFRIIDIEDASNWGHDFKDGRGRIEGAYGPWFLRLAVPGHKGIGIHGTHKPESIGTRDTEGCIRLANEDIADLKTRVSPGMVVIVLASYNDLAADKNPKQTNKDKAL